MSNVDILDFRICDKCGMKFPKRKPPRLQESAAETLRCPVEGCGRTFKTQGDMDGVPSRDSHPNARGAAVWL